VLDIILYVYVISSSFEIFCSISDEKCGEIIRHRKKIGFHEGAEQQ